MYSNKFLLAILISIKQNVGNYFKHKRLNPAMLHFCVICPSFVHETLLIIKSSYLFLSCYRNEFQRELIFAYLILEKEKKILIFVM